jgi:hypothetical protein
MAIQVDFAAILNVKHGFACYARTAVSRHIADDICLTYLSFLKKTVKCLGFGIVGCQPADGMNAISKQAIENRVASFQQSLVFYFP